MGILENKKFCLTKDLILLLEVVPLESLFFWVAQQNYVGQSRVLRPIKKDMMNISRKLVNHRSCIGAMEKQTQIEKQITFRRAILLRWHRKTRKLKDLLKIYCAKMQKQMKICRKFAKKMQQRGCKFINIFLSTRRNSMSWIH